MENQNASSGERKACLPAVGGDSGYGTFVRVSSLSPPPGRDQPNPPPRTFLRSTKYSGPSLAGSV